MQHNRGGGVDPSKMRENVASQLLLCWKGVRRVRDTFSRLNFSGYTKAGSRARIKKAPTVFAGYRVIGIQKTEGSGVNKDAFNLGMEGALIGLNVVLF